MGAPESEHIYGIQIRESATDGSDFSNADADYRKLFLGEDGNLHLKDSTGSVTDVGGGGSGTDVVGRVHLALPVGLFLSGTVSTAITLAAVSGGNGGALWVPIVVPAPMLLQQIGVWNLDTASARSAEARIYLDAGSATCSFVTGTDVAWSFTPSAASSRTADVSGAPVTLDPGMYLVVIRNTSATQVFSIGRSSNSTITSGPGNYRTQAIAALGSSQDMDTGWTSQTGGIPAVWLEGRVVGRSSEL